MLAAYHRKQKKTVRIVVPNKLLLRQYQQELAIYFQGSGVDVRLPTQITREVNEPDIFICDEFDYILENQAANFAFLNRSLTLFGLASVFHSEKAYFFSATYDKYHIKLLAQVFDITSQKILDCKNS